ncbi:MAG: excinuclease ABC subunit UvrC, partial [Pseudomonadota bacterium]
PCVGFVDEAAYAEQVDQAIGFLSGKSRTVADEFAAKMNEASEALDFEIAARYRDRIRALSAVQAQQDINVDGIEEADAFALYQEGGHTCIQVYFVRGGRNYGTRAYFPSHDKSLERGKVMTAFLGQFYENKVPSRAILTSVEPAERDLLAEALSIRADRKVEILVPARGAKRRLIDHAAGNAREALARRLAESSSQRRLLTGLADLFNLDTPPQRIEVYDNSHISGTNAIGAMIVAGPEGFTKNAYRKFTIKEPDAAGDDYAMMREVLSRRFARALREDPDRESGNHWPDLVLIDGGKGQLNAVLETLGELGIDDVPIVSIAKGPDRNAGRETFFMADRDSFQLEPTDPVLYYLQRLRDEAHRFAISTHRAKRSASIGRSAIDEIEGIGPRRKKALLNHFGSARAVSAAGLADLERVDGISRSVAKKIHDHFRQGR